MTTRSIDQTTADYYSFLHDNFEDAARAFCEHSLAKDLADWADVWKSDAVRNHLLVIAMDIAREDAMDEDQMNDFVDARLKALPWVSISAEVL
jgi:hypothetical protein